MTPNGDSREGISSIESHLQLKIVQKGDEKIKMVNYIAEQKHSHLISYIYVYVATLFLQNFKTL